ncbi:MAG: hypothetical protein JKX84_10690, partial [Flavobacteriales bacterium]|nr:hypothetical protein [Flavobacteriales bacterium]
MIFKSIKKAFAWTTLLLLFLVLVIGGGYMALRSPRVQTRLTQYVADFLSDELQTVVSVQGVDIGFFNRLIIEDLYLQDLKGDTLGYLQNLHLGISSFDLDENQIYFGRVRLDGLKLYVKKHEGDQKLNTQFLIDYFKQEKKGDTPYWDIRSEEIELRNASFQYQNNHKQEKESGVDYWHLDVQNINLLIDNIRLEGDTIFGNMARMNFMEHRGFFVKNLAGKV